MWPLQEMVTGQFSSMGPGTQPAATDRAGGQPHQLLLKESTEGSQGVLGLLSDSLKLGLWLYQALG